jgi:hypothetical protein
MLVTSNAVRLEYKLPKRREYAAFPKEPIKFIRTSAIFTILEEAE